MMKCFKKLIVMILVSLVACGKTCFSIQIDVYKNPDSSYLYADEKITPVGDYIYVETNSKLGDTMVVVLEEGKVENDAFGTYLTHGLSSKIAVEKGKIYKIGILNKEEYSKPTSSKTFTIQVKGVNILIED